MRDAHYRKLGMFIGSGDVEAGCKAVIDQANAAGPPRNVIMVTDECVAHSEFARRNGG